jgi:alpha-tubulin suppressor-like RCC1 family protein
LNCKDVHEIQKDNKGLKCKEHDLKILYKNENGDFSCEKCINKKEKIEDIDVNETVKDIYLPKLEKFIIKKDENLEILKKRKRYLEDEIEQIKKERKMNNERINFENKNIEILKNIQVSEGMNFIFKYKNFIKNSMFMNYEKKVDFYKILKFGNIDHFNLNIEEYTPKEIMFKDFKINDISGGCNFTHFLNEKNQLFSFGSNLTLDKLNCGQLGLGHYNDVSLPTHNIFLKHKKIIKLSCGYLHTLVLTGLIISF